MAEREFIIESALRLYLLLFTPQAQKEKKQEENAEGVPTVATVGQGSAFGNRKFFEKSLAKNFLYAVARVCWSGH